MLNHVCLFYCPVMSLVMSSHVVFASGEVHQAHGAGGDKRGEEAAQIPLPLPGEPSSHFVTFCHNIVTQVRMCHGDVISQVNRPIQVHISISIDVYYFHYGSYFHNLSTISNIYSAYNLRNLKPTYNLQSEIYNLNLQSLQGKYIQHLDTESAAFR